ncbi:MAG: RcnB family protein [Novosphingobium sp.]
MRKIILIAMAAAVSFPVAANAQSAGEVRRDHQEVHRDREQVRRDMRHGDYRRAEHDRQETREDRRELREDWRDYRNSHRDTFRGGSYQGPRGYRYRPVSNGFRLDLAYYDSRYWISDPLRYRLPLAGRGLRWIRYGNDVLLVNVRTGRVVQVNRAFFW